MVRAWISLAWWLSLGMCIIDCYEFFVSHMEIELLTRWSHGVLPLIAPGAGIRERIAKAVSVLNEYLAKGYYVYGETGFS